MFSLGLKGHPMLRHLWQAGLFLAMVCGPQPLARAVETADLIERCEPVVVCIRTDSGIGSGVLIDSNQHVATNYHVIEGATEGTATFSDRASYRVLGYVAVDKGRDLAILKIEGNRRNDRVPLAKVLPRKGERALAIGAPRNLQFSSSEGIISAVRAGRELEDLIPGLNAQMGYDRDATWLQTTVPISAGNSGGPLISSSGEIVGLNTWSRTDGQNLNFAISATEIGRLRDRAKPDYTALAKLRSRRGVSKLIAPPSGRPRIVLPSGKVLTDSMFDLDERRERLRIDNDHSLARREHPNGKWYLAAAHHGGVLDGAAFSRYETDEPAFYATYADGKRNGVVIKWDAAGEKTYFGQYAKGKRHGVCCLFENGSVITVIECHRDNIRGVHILEAGAVKHSFETEAKARANATPNQQLERLVKLESEIKKDEREFRKEVAADELRRRQEVVGSNNVVKRARGQARINARRAAQGEFMDSIRRRALGN